MKISSLLHDIGRFKEKSEKLNHAELSAEMAERFLKSITPHFSPESIKKILHCIRAYSFSNQVKPITIEAKILSDTDKLDALGAIGLYRTIGFTVKKGGNLDNVIYHLEEKILNLKNLLYLARSKEMAK